MVTQRQYWDKKINEWSASSYNLNTSRVGIVEKIAAHFRQVDNRERAALSLLRNLVKGKIVLDMGCGLGDFCFDLLLEKPKKVIGLDIADSAVHIAKQRAKENKVSKKVDFIRSDVVKMKKLPQCDIVVGLGFIDYLTADQHRHLFSLISDRPYLFSFFEKKRSLFNLLHTIYIKSQGCPGAYKFSRGEMRSMVSGKCYLVQKFGLQFITNSSRLKSPEKKSLL